MDDKQKIEEGVQLYFDSMYESSAEKVRQAFYENAMITGYMETGLAEMTVDQFAKFVEDQQPSPKEKGEDILLEILKQTQWNGARQVTCLVKILQTLMTMLYCF